MVAEYWQKYGRYVFFGIGIGLIILGLLISFWESNQPPSANDVEFLTTKEASPSAANSKITIYLAGAVNKPGVYELPASSRLYQAVDQAGGISDKADSDWIEKNYNLARELSDGEKIYFPVQGEQKPDQPIKQTNNSVLGQSNLINLNLASQSELETLSGVGPATAEIIITYRQENNGFKSIEEIQAVPGIGEKTFEKLKDKISI
jgi:competence protein ComEA